MAIVNHQITEEAIRQTFYNTMVCQIHDDNIPLREIHQATSEIKVAMIAHTIIEVLNSSHDVHNGLYLLKRQIVDLNNCPQGFGRLLNALLEIKRQVNDVDARVLKRLMLPGQRQIVDQRLTYVVNAIKNIAIAITQRDTFKELIDNVIKFSLECSGIVTEEEMRKTFYNLMINEVMSAGLIPQDDIRDRDPYVFGAFSAHTIIAGIRASKGREGAIHLLNGMNLTLENCPDMYQPLTEMILRIKDQVTNLSEEEAVILKRTSLNEEGRSEGRNPALMRLAANINSVASRISQLPTFKAIIESVMQIVTGGQ